MQLENALNNRKPKKIMSERGFSLENRAYDKGLPAGSLLWEVIQGTRMEGMERVKSERRERHSKGALLSRLNHCEQLGLHPLGLSKELCALCFRSACPRRGEGNIHSPPPGPIGRDFPKGCLTLLFSQIGVWSSTVEQDPTVPCKAETEEDTGACLLWPQQLPKSKGESIDFNKINNFCSA